jgi:hypothetical protein
MPVMGLVWFWLILLGEDPTDDASMIWPINYPTDLPIETGSGGSIRAMLDVK